MSIALEYIIYYEDVNIVMPRQRRKHHSRSRSRSHSHDKDRDAKRRKLEIYDSPNHKRSVSPPINPIHEENPSKAEDQVETSMCEEDRASVSSDVIVLVDSGSECGSRNTSPTKVQKSVEENEVTLKDSNVTPKKNSKDSNMDCDNDILKNELTKGSVQQIIQDKTPTRRLTPKQLEKRLESEKKRQMKEKEKEERERQKQLEKEQKETEKQKKKEQKLKEIEQKQKEKEEKEEQKRQEKELKLKQKEEEKMRKQQEIDEKNKEKLKEEEKKQKAAAAFVSFFVPKKFNNAEDKKNEETTSAFMPFEVKCDMKLPPPRREPLTTDEKKLLEKLIQHNETQYSYIKDLKKSKSNIRRCPRTWVNKDSDEVIIIEDEILLGETICEEQPKSEKMRVKLLQFHENQRPAYYGTWRKKSKNIRGRKPWGKEDLFDYEVDSDDDWEEEEQGENLEVLSDDEKENEPENDDYEVDNDFFVPHGHLSDDEVDDEEFSKLSPESQKQKLKLLKDEFDEDIKSKTQKIKPRSIGCIWYNKIGDNIDKAIDKYLRPFNIITSGRIEIKKRDLESIDGNPQKKKRVTKPLPENLMQVLAKLVHGNIKKREKLVTEFLEYIHTNNVGLELSKTNISKQISQIAKWSFNVGIKAYCWIVSEDVADKYKIDYVLPNIQDTVENSLNNTK
ncbi:chromatin assembly factor 1 subunit A isoform X2 [Harmonia axyridis]|uniref:chromatin assembly factor 1 subunit A isoform X2 n=1 Tax=Harmonia axyridis TaxID=115357 RepID=UPI001E27546A|nr:chromatin assembly factor 1 subunit A isoform X2 [Harmonia axyridis]